MNTSMRRMLYNNMNNIIKIIINYHVRLNKNCVVVTSNFESSKIGKVKST